MPIRSLLLRSLSVVFLLILSGLVQNAPTVLGQSPQIDKYTMRERFGVGGRVTTFDKIPGEAYYDLGIGWYYTWEYGEKYGGVAQLGPRPEHDLEYVGMVGGYHYRYPTSVDDTPCATLHSFVEEHPGVYPDGMSWTVGNEIGVDDISRIATPAQSAREFVQWRACLKHINPTYRVGTGAFVPNLKLPVSPDLSLSFAERLCATDAHRDAGAAGVVEVDGVTRYAAPNYFVNMIRVIRSTYGVDHLPEFVTFHPYLVCAFGEEGDTTKFRQTIFAMRRAMQEAGLRDLDLIANEFSYTSDDQVKVIDRMEDFVEVLATLRDPELGHRGDNDRMVQKWAWFIFWYWGTDDSDWKTISLYEPGSPPSYRMSPVGEKYQELITSYTVESTCTIQGYKLNPAYQPNAALDELTVSATDGETTSTAGNPYFLRLPGNRKYTVLLEAADTQTVASTACQDHIGCHSLDDPSRRPGPTRATVYCPAGGYVDLWWHIEP